MLYSHLCLAVSMVFCLFKTPVSQLRLMSFSRTSHVNDLFDTSNHARVSCKVLQCHMAMSCNRDIVGCIRKVLLKQDVAQLRKRKREKKREKVHSSFQPFKLSHSLVEYFSKSPSLGTTLRRVRASSTASRQAAAPDFPVTLFLLCCRVAYLIRVAVAPFCEHQRMLRTS